MKRRTFTAVVFTAVYLAVVAVVVWSRECEVFGLPLNSLGDFLAGAFGPLALAWLIFGYFQQGDELRQGTEALKVQAEELRNSVEQQSRIAEISLKTLELQAADRVAEEKKYRSSLRPILDFGEANPSFSNSLWIAESGFYNDGAQIYSVEIYASKGKRKRLCSSFRTMHRDGEEVVNIIWGVDDGDGDLTVDVLYLEQDSTPGVARFKALRGDDFGTIMFVKDEGFSS